MRLPWVILEAAIRVAGWWRDLARAKRRRLVAASSTALVLAALAHLVAHGALVRELVLERAALLARAHGFELRAVGDATIAWPGRVELSGVVVESGGTSFEAREVTVAPAWLALARGEVRVGTLSVSDARASLAGVTWLVPEVELTRDDGGGATIDLLLAGGGAAELEATLGSTPTAVGRLTGLSAADLPEELGARLGIELAGSWDGELELTGERVLVTLATRDLVVAGETVASEPVGPFAVRARADLAWDSAARRLSVVEALLELGPDAVLSAGAAGFLELEGGAELDLTLAVPDLARLVTTLPPTLRPPPGAPGLRGPLSASVLVRGPTHRPAEWVVESEVDLSGSRAAAARDSGTYLAGDFTHVVTDVLGREHEILVAPESPHFVPLAELPSYVKDAVIASEDAGFPRHQGFDFDEIKNSVLAVASAGRAVRGGSTISQQLAKNLFLSREKTYARKVREALVTIALESALPKARLLEIYLNVIEWGPGIYGIGPAARAYFDADARALTPREAAYLASIIPSPLRHYARYARGELSDSSASRIDALLLTLSERGQLSPDVYDEALVDSLGLARN